LSASSGFSRRLAQSTVSHSNAWRRPGNRFRLKVSLRHRQTTRPHHLPRTANPRRRSRRRRVISRQFPSFLDRHQHCCGLAVSLDVAVECQLLLCPREHMSRVTTDNVTAAVRKVRATSLKEKEALADEIHRCQPHMLASCLVQSRLGVERAGARCSAGRTPCSSWNTQRGPPRMPLERITPVNIQSSRCWHLF
jgi:hypothetical protein